MRLLASFLLLIGIAGASANTWLYPSLEIIHSRDGNIVARIEPVPSLERGDRNKHAIATITKWVKKEGSYRFVKRMTLRNPEMPGTSLITNDGRFLVALDDWGPGVGRTDNTVVIYDLREGTIHNHRLEEFLPASYIEKLKQAHWAFTWHRDALVDEMAHIICVYLPDTKADSHGLEPYIAIDPVKNKIWMQKE